MRLLPKLIICFLLLFPADKAWCQQQNATTRLQYEEQNKAIFEDDFSGDTAGSFPKRWVMYPAIAMNIDLNGYMHDAENYSIAKRMINGVPVLEIHSHYSNMRLAPVVGTPSYLKDTFNIEFDAVMEKEGSDIAATFYDDRGNYIFEIRMYGTGRIISLLSITPTEEYNGLYAHPYQVNQWHHYAYVYRNPAMTLYVDGERAYTIPDCSFPPTNMTIAGNSYVKDDPYVRLKNFKIYSGIENRLNRMLIDKKLTTHAILFDVNKSLIKPESLPFIAELAAWLKQNNHVTLEIDGHTDSDGDPNTNLKLSQDRANEVRNQLIKYGVSKNRLTARGYGSTKPLQPNTTAEGKENNRRVEFIAEN